MRASCAISSRIAISASRVATTATSWKRVAISDSTFNGNTNYGLWVGGVASAPTIDDNTFTDNASYAAYLSGGYLKSYSGNSGSGNAVNGFAVQGTVGDVTDSTFTWSGGAPTFPFVLAGDVTVADDETLQLAAGTVIKFAAGTQMSVHGTLQTAGTAGQPVVGSAASGSHTLCSGFWCRTEAEYRVYLPLVLR